MDPGWALPDPTIETSLNSIPPKKIISKIEIGSDLKKNWI